MLAFATEWRSVLYTCSDEAYQELAGMRPDKADRAARLLGWALEMRESHPAEYREVNRKDAPSDKELMALGLNPKDALHVADAVHLGADYFLTRDGRIRDRARQIEARWQLHILTPAEFLETVARPHNSGGGTT